MRHTIVKLTGLLMVLALTLTGCNLIGIDPMMQLDEDFAKLDKDYAAVVAEYDGGTVTKGEVLGRFASMYSYYAQMYSMFGMNMTNDVVDGIKQQSAEGAIEAVAVQKELEKRGLSLSEDKLAEVQKTADENYKSAFDSFYAHAEGKGEVKDRQTEYDMYQNGYSKELFYQTQLDEANHALLEENVEAEISELTDEELQEAYDEQVAGDQDLYGEDVSAFESAMASSDEDDALIAWMPDGYRTVKHILVKPADDVLSAVTDARTALSDAESALADFETELSDLNDDDDEETADDEAVEGEDEAEEEAEEDEAEEDEAEEETAEPETTEAPRTAEEIQADIDKARADVDAAKKTVADAEAACLESVKEKTDEIYAKIEAGEDFESLIAEYGEDPGMQNEPTATRGYYVTAAQGNWDKNFNDASMALENVGDVTMPPVISTSGVHIIKYMSDVTGGAVPLEEIRDKLYETTLATRKEDHFDETLTSLIEALNPVYHMEAFDVA